VKRPPAGIPSDQESRLRRYEELIRERSATLGLVSSGDLPRLWERHILDSLRAASFFLPSDRVAVDIGSGAGLPGLVLAIALPRCRFVLLEPSRRRAGFLELAVERLEVGNAEVLIGRASDVDLEADVATARALAPAPVAWTMAYELLRPGGRLLYFAGSEDAVEAARAAVDPAPPVSVETVGGLANPQPLVIMARG
jgi:16S rRNA (guanine527-N7)-methyltransferase